MPKEQSDIKTAHKISLTTEDIRSALKNYVSSKFPMMSGFEPSIEFQAFDSIDCLNFYVDDLESATLTYRVEAKN